MAKYFTKQGDDYVEVSENLLTQADVDGVVEKRLERERGKFADYDSLKEKAGKVDSITKEFTDKITAKDAEITKLTGDVATANLATSKVKIVSEFKLSDELAEFVTGDTEEDMRARAEKLSKGFKGGGVPIEKNKKPDQTETEAKKLAGKLFPSKSGD